MTQSYYRARYYEIALRDIFSRNPVLQRKVRRGGEIAECATLHVRKGVFWGERAPGTHVPGYDIVQRLPYMCGYEIVASLRGLTSRRDQPVEFVVIDIVASLRGSTSRRR